jgi:integrase
MELTRISENLRQGIKANGIKYTVRDSRQRYFYPNEWDLFYKSLKVYQRPLFDFLINTGARIDEAVHIRPIDFDFERNNVRIWKVKVKAAIGEKVGQPRIISLSTEFADRMRRACYRINKDKNVFPFNKYTAWQLLRRKLKEIGMKDYALISIHNIRKTHGMYIKALGYDATEICLRLGHDYNTFLKHYGSADIFSEVDIINIRKIIGDLHLRSRNRQ